MTLIWCLLVVVSPLGVLTAPLHFLSTNRGVEIRTPLAEQEAAPFNEIEDSFQEDLNLSSLAKMNSFTLPFIWNRVMYLNSTRRPALTSMERLFSYLSNGAGEPTQVLYEPTDPYPLVVGSNDVEMSEDDPLLFGEGIPYIENKFITRDEFVPNRDLMPEPDTVFVPQPSRQLEPPTNPFPVPYPSRNLEPHFL